MNAQKLKPYELRIAAYSSNDFTSTTTPEGFWMSAFASDLNIPPTGAGMLKRLYNDACDVGVAIRSERTGVVSRFYLVREEVKGGDLVAWHFEALTSDKMLANGTKVTIFND